MNEGLDQLPFAWRAVRYESPNTKAKGQKNATHVMMSEPYCLGKWDKPAGYVLCASPITTRDPRHWQAAEGEVTCSSCLGRVTWFLGRYAEYQRSQAQGKKATRASRAVEASTSLREDVGDARLDVSDDEKHRAVEEEEKHG